jgi:hypothetical protein
MHSTPISLALYLSRFKIVFDGRGFFDKVNLFNKKEKLTRFAILL